LGLKAKTTRETSRLSQLTFERAEQKSLYLATFSYFYALIKTAFPEGEVDTEYATARGLAS